MKKEIELRVEPTQVASVVVGLSRIDGIQARIPNQRLPKPSDTKRHGSYSMSFAELAPVIISISGTVTSLIALATAILQLQSEKHKGRATDAKDTAKPLVVIKQDIVSLSGFDSPEKLAAYIKRMLE